MTRLSGLTFKSFLGERMVGAKESHQNVKACHRITREEIVEAFRKMKTGKSS